MPSGPAPSARPAFCTTAPCREGGLDHYGTVPGTNPEQTDQKGTVPGTGAGGIAGSGTFDGVELPDGYVDALSDELAPYGFEFLGVRRDAEGLELDFRADPDSFVRHYPDLGIAESYGQSWPPVGLHLRLRVDGRGDPVQLDFETIDVLVHTASVDPELRDRLNTLADPADHAVAVGQAVAAALVLPEDNEQRYLD